GEVGRADIGTVGTLLKRLHDAPVIGGRFDSFRVVEAYAAAASGRGRSLPRVFGWAHELARQIEALRAAAPRVTCHNDLLAANFIDDGERVWLVDWERSEEHTSELQSLAYLVCRLLLEKKKRNKTTQSNR